MPADAHQSLIDHTTHQQESALAISATWDKAEDGSYTATVRVSGLSSEEQAKGDVRRMREALSAPSEQALPQLPQAKWIEIDTPGADFDTTLVATMAEARDMLDLEEKDEHT